MTNNPEQKEQQTITVQAVEAQYSTEGLLQEYTGNPLIEALPGIVSHREVIRSLRVLPLFNESERNFSSESRLHCIGRLFWHFFQPMEQHIRIWDYISLCIRQGYIRRNPLDILSTKRANELYAAAMEKRKPTVPSEYIPNSVGFAIVGVSGVGKSTTVLSILNKYPQVIQHTKYKDHELYIKQIVWLKLDCSHDGTERGLCLSFLREIDRLVGTRYFEAYEKRATVDTLLTEMTRLASAYSLGILLVDEIQHLAESRNGSKKLLNFFVTLENTIGVPVVLMGTPGALPLLQGDFRSARRCCAHGDVFWNPLQWDSSIQNSEWEMFLKTMWKFQWIQKPVEINVNFVSRMYDETQGIEALAVILFMLLQEEAIRNGSETIQLSDVNLIAQKNMKVVQPMLKALRSNDPKKIARYSDIIITLMANDTFYSNQTDFEADEKQGNSTKTPNEKIVAEYLQEMKILPEQAEKYAQEVVKANPNANPMLLLRDALLRYEADRTSTGNKTESSEDAVTKSSNQTRKDAAEKAKAEDPEDLRNR